MHACFIVVLHSAGHGLLLQADWNIVKRGWDAHVLGKAPFKFTDPVEAIKSLRVRSASLHMLD